MQDHLREDFKSSACSHTNKWQKTKWSTDVVSPREYAMRSSTDHWIYQDSVQLSRHQGQLRRRGRRCCRCWSRDSPAGHGDECGKAGSTPQPIEDYVGADIYATAHEGPHAAAGWHAVKKAAAPRECTMQQVFWQELWPLGDLHWSSMFLMDCTPWWSSFWRTVFSGIQVGAVCEELYPMGDTSWWSRGRMWGGRSSGELTTTPILHISCIARSRKESRRIRNDIKPVKNRVKSCVKVFSVLILFLSFLLSY